MYILSFYIPNDLASFLLYEFPVVDRYRSFSFIDSEVNAYVGYVQYIIGGGVSKTRLQNLWMKENVG